MTGHEVGTRKEWLAARVELLEREKELTRRSDELARHGEASAASRPPVAAVKAKPAPALPVTRPSERMRAPSLSRGDTSVLVLNGNGLTGAAGTEAARIKRLGYTVARVGDAARMDYPASVVMYRPGFKPEGVRLARDLGIRVVGPLDGVRVRELLGAQAAVVVGHQSK